MSTQTFAQLSNGFVYGAMGVLTLAMFAFAAELAFGTRSRVGRIALAGESARLVAVGASATAAGSAGSAGVVDITDVTQVVENSYMLPQGARWAAKPRQTTPRNSRIVARIVSEKAMPP